MEFDSSRIQSSSPIWRPFTQMKTSPEPLKVIRGSGIWLYLEDGRKIIDGISSWWVTIHGHSHPLLAAALYNQASHLEHVIFANFTHEPAEKLARKLINHTPEPLTKVFFSDNGSTAVEVALKMAYQYRLHKTGVAAPRFIAFENGYHGDTLGAMSLGKSSEWFAPFAPLTIPCDFIPFPATFDNDPDVEQKERDSLEALEALIKAAPNQHSAIFVEPLIQGSAGMKMCRSEFLKKLCKLCKDHNILVIYDEVMTGFGRTGELFACLKSDTAPDLLCLSKGLSGGCLPLAVTITTDEIFDAFCDDDPRKAFYHGHSYTGNPLACATGIASLELLESTPNLLSEIEHHHRRLMNTYLLGHGKVENLRLCGTIMAFEVKVADPGYFNSIKETIAEKALQQGVLLRPLGNTVYFMPPYCICEEDMEHVYKTLRNILDSL